MLTLQVRNVRHRSIGKRYTSAVTRVYEEIVDFIAAGTKPSDVAGFQPSEESRRRVGDLITREKDAGLSADESAELDHYLQLEHIMRLAKARARLHLAP
jgi:hypothetical protein